MSAASTAGGGGVRTAADGPVVLPPTAAPAPPQVVPAADPWAALRATTPARIGLGRVGAGLPTRAVLELEAAHAQARDAVHTALDARVLVPQLHAASAAVCTDVVVVDSCAPDRGTYLRRPDLGRRLSPQRTALLRDLADGAPTPDVAVVVADGLSATAVHRHAVGLVRELAEQLHDWTWAPLVVARQARVALGDDVGAVLDAQLVIVLIGERPGLSAPDSLGAYLTWHPRPGLSDAARNCVSNIRPPVGLGLRQAATTIARLATAARRRRLTGVHLKDTGPTLGR